MTEYRLRVQVSVNHDSGEARYVEVPVYAENDSDAKEYADMLYPNGNAVLYKVEEGETK